MAGPCSTARLRPLKDEFRQSRFQRQRLTGTKLFALGWPASRAAPLAIHRSRQPCNGDWLGDPAAGEAWPLSEPLSATARSPLPDIPRTSKATNATVNTTPLVKSAMTIHIIAAAKGVCAVRPQHFRQELEHGRACGGRDCRFPAHALVGIRVLAWPGLLRGGDVQAGLEHTEADVILLSGGVAQFDDSAVFPASVQAPSEGAESNSCKRRRSASASGISAAQLHWMQSSNTRRI